jgi:stress response protein SCP2
MDIDSSVVLASGKRKYDLVYYGNLRGAGVNHKGDDLTGSDKKGEYDNEEIEIDLNRVPSNVDRLIFVANIYRGEERGQHFGQVSKGAYIRVLNSSNREELIRYELSQEFDKLRGIVVGELYRYNGDWKFKAIGQGTPKSNLTNLVDLSL